jgi:hypothetical protein
MSESEHQARRELETAGQIADLCHPDRIPSDVNMAQARATIGVGLVLLVVAEELRESRAELANLFVANSQRWSQPVIQPASNQIEVREVIRPDRGHVALALLVMAGTIVLLLVLCVVLALT